MLFPFRSDNFTPPLQRSWNHFEVRRCSCASDVSALMISCFPSHAVRKHPKQDSTMNEEWKSMFGSQEPPPIQTAMVTVTIATAVWSKTADRSACERDCYLAACAGQRWGRHSGEEERAGSSGAGAAAAGHGPHLPAPPQHLPSGAAAAGAAEEGAEQRRAHGQADDGERRVGESAAAAR